jgi:hypothetical protein
VAYHQFTECAPLQLLQSESESRRFGMHVGRIDIGLAMNPAASRVAELVVASDCDLVILRLDAASAGFVSDLRGALPSHEVIHADTLLYYSSKGQHLETENPAELVPVEPESRAFQECLRSVFAEYTNHYAANPVTRDVKMADVYSEWASSIPKGPTLMTAGVPSIGGLLNGCLIAQLEPTDPGERNTWEVLLAGVTPQMRGAGMYGALLRAFNVRMKQLESDWVISTQAWNIAAQRAWTRVGLRLDGALMTLHLQRRLLGAELER